MPVADDDDAADDEDVLLLDVLAVEVLVPAVPPEPEGGRLPRRRGAMRAANRSAVTTPLRRMVLWMSPVVMVAVRTAATSALDVSAPTRALAIHATPAKAATAATTVLRAEALLM